MDRRQFLISGPLVGLACRGGQRGQLRSANDGRTATAANPSDGASSAIQRRIALTIDDPSTDNAPLYSVEDRNGEILKHLAQRRLQAMFFVCGKRVDSPSGAKLLRTLSDAGHLLANHSYSHRNYNEAESSVEAFVTDVSKCERLIGHHAGFRKFFRFPYLKEGESREKRNALRNSLREQNYVNGHVTIDASDWAYSGRLTSRLEEDAKLDLEPFRKAYLAHILDRARYYDGLATTVTGYSVPHTLLIHHNLLNALFLGDLIDALQKEDYRIVAPEEDYADPVFEREPANIPAGEGLVWALAHGDARLRAGLRYPAETRKYEADVLERL